VWDTPGFTINKKITQNLNPNKKTLAKPLKEYPDFGKKNLDNMRTSPAVVACRLNPPLYARKVVALLPYVAASTK